MFLLDYETYLLNFKNFFVTLNRQFQLVTGNDYEISLMRSAIQRGEDFDKYQDLTQTEVS